MAQFHETRMGMRFFESDIPKLIDALTRIASKLEPRAPVVQDALTAEVVEANVVRLRIQQLIPVVRNITDTVCDAREPRAAGEELCALAEQLAELSK
jgi:hypothetical protein